MANVFLVSPDLGPEDRLTAYWHYVLDALPGGGQAFVDHVSSRSGLAQSKFLGSVDHPRGDRVNRPDFLIRCRDYDVLFEHKLDSLLGRRQLERYLTLCQTRGQKLALVAASSLPLEHQSAIPLGSSALVRLVLQRIFCGKTFTKSSGVFPIELPTTLQSSSQRGDLRTSIGRAWRSLQL